ncbi:MAG: tetratricopeptide repeat protein [Halioglobus sp.]|nr:tetratricopeptide repeat protein [Halioglobus sp.]
MLSPVMRKARYPLRPSPGRGCHAAFAIFFCTTLLACSTTTPDIRLVSHLPPLPLGDQLVAVADVQARVPTPDLLALNEDMREFVQRYTEGVGRDRERLMMLHRAIRGPATLGIQYDSQAQGTAQDVFYRGSANCLSYAALFIALAREADLNANYQWLEVRPQWTQEGERVMVRRHVNVVVQLPRMERYMVDIDPQPSRDIAGSVQMSDADAQAVHHSNIAMEALASGDTEQAWLQGVRALQLSPGLAHLWVNLGVVYRSNGQHDEAERSYLYALQLDSKERSAMNNLVVLYAMQGREDEHNYWERRVAKYRDANPYYHAWLGDRAAKDEDWKTAASFYEKAVALSPQESQLLSALAESHAQLDEPETALVYLQRAIEFATLQSERFGYQQQLDAMQRERLAGT